MLDDRDRRVLKGACDANRGVEVEEVVVRELFPLELLERTHSVADVESRLLLGVLAVAKVLELAQCEREFVGLPGCGTAEEGGDRRVIAGSLFEDRDCGAEPEGIADFAALELCDEVGIERWVAEREDVLVV